MAPQPPPYSIDHTSVTNFLVNAYITYESERRFDPFQYIGAKHAIA
jgi:hypothetical protein